MADRGSSHHIGMLAYPPANLGVQPWLLQLLLTLCPHSVLVREQSPAQPVLDWTSTEEDVTALSLQVICTKPSGIGCATWQGLAFRCRIMYKG